MKFPAKAFAAVLIAAAAFAAAPASAASRTTTTRVTTHTHAGIHHNMQRPSHTRVVRTHIHRHRPVCRTNVTRVMRHGHVVVRKVRVCR